MAEWGIPFDHIEAHWTDRQFLLFLNRRNERIEEMNRQSGSHRRRGSVETTTQTMSLREFKKGYGIGA